MSASERPESPLGAELATALVASAEDAIIATALDGTITSWNAAATRLYGYDAADVVGRPLVGLAPPDAVDDVHETIAQIAAGVRLEPFDTVRRHRSGRALDVSTTASAIHASDGTLVAVSWVERDVTGR